MKKIKNFKLKVSMLIFVLVLMVVQIGPFLVYADESELSFSYRKFTQPATNEYYNSRNLYFSQARVGQYVGYCLDYGLPLPTSSSGGTVKYVRTLSPVTTAVMKYGYPYSTAAQLGVNSDEEAELATQLAVWSVVNASTFTDAQKSPYIVDMDNLKPVAGYEAYMSRVKAAAQRLIDRAVADPYYSDPKFYINPASAKMTVGNEYMIAGPYEVRATGFDVSSITVSLSGAPASAQITDASGNVKTTVNNGDNIYVKMLRTEEGSELTINVSASGNTVVGKVYGTGNANDGKQDYGIIVPSPVQLNDSTKLKWSTLTGNVKIYKVDQYNNIISGVKFELRDLNDKVVASGITDANGILEFKNIKIGTYKLVETEVPDNYVMATEAFQFEVTVGNTKEITFQNKKLAPGKIKITKIDQNNNTIPGCTFELKDANGNLIYTGTTDANGILEFDNLEEGKYYLQETSAPEGYVMKKDPVELNVPNNKILSLKFPNRKINSVLKIIKVDENEVPLEGVTFEILDANKKVIDTIVTNKEGIAESNVKLTIGKYYYKEISAPNNIIIDTKEYEFEITGYDDVVIKNIENKIKKGKFQIYKTVENKPLEGVTFEILNANKEVVETITTDANGIATTKELTKGTYYYKEIKVPEGIRLDSTEYKFTMDYQDVRKEVKNKYITGTLKIIKVDENKEPLQGVTFEILNANKIVIDTIVTNEYGIAQSNVDLKIGKYYYREIAAPNNIIIDTNVYEFEINGVDDIVIRNIENKIKKGKLQIYKTTEDGKALEGVTFQILNVNKKVVETITTDANGIATTKELPKGTYYYKETKVPNGIKLDSTEYEFTMDYQDVRKDVVNEYFTGTLKIIKVDENKVPLEGVTFEILDANKKVIDTIVTNKEGIAQSNVELRIGTYYYREISAPNNIIIDTKEYKFEINGVDDVVIRNIENKIKKGKLQIYKTTEDGKALEGVTFEILDANKKVVDKITTGKDGIATTKELPKGTYYYKETKVPFGIKLDSTEYEFTMDYQDVRKEVVNKYATGTLKIIKVDENDIPVQGVKFEIYDKDKKLVDTIVTDKKGIAESNVELTLGTYYYKEVEAPDNVIMDTEMHEFELTEDGQVVIKNLVNKLVRGKLRIVKTTETGTPVENVTFQILNEAKDVIETITTDKDGIAETKPLKAGKYYYRETEAPVNVIADYTEYEFIVESNDQVIEKQVVNELVKGSLKIIKTDDLKAPLANVKFEILDKDKNVIQTIVTDENGVAVSDKLVLGKYYYREVEAPENVVMDTKEYEFKITENEQIIEKEITNKRIEGKLIIYKQDKDTKQPLANVTFQVLNESKEVIETITTDKDGIARLGGLLKGKYYFKEVEAPENYIMNTEEYAFEIVKDMQTVEATVYNEHVKLPVTGGFIGTNTLIVIIVAVVVIAGYITIKLVLSRKH